jgi:hypothetical protein
MTWENIHIDHIRPCASFDLSDPEQQKLCFNYKNLRPMLAHENLSKNSTWNGKRWTFKKNLTPKVSSDYTTNMEKH